MTFDAPQPDWCLAEVNVARLKAPLGDPLVAPFEEALDRINALSERMDGFVWRFVDDSGGATDTKVLDDSMVIYNASIWRDVASLERFVWGTVHARFFERRAEWFQVMDTVHFAMWWVPPDTTFSPAEATDRLAHLQKQGPTDRAFGWKEAPGAEMWQAGQHARV